MVQKVRFLYALLSFFMISAEGRAKHMKAHLYLKKMDGAQVLQPVVPNASSASSNLPVLSEFPVPLLGLK